MGTLLWERARRSQSLAVHHWGKGGTRRDPAGEGGKRLRRDGGAVYGWGEWGSGVPGKRREDRRWVPGKRGGEQTRGWSGRAASYLPLATCRERALRRRRGRKGRGR